MRSIRAGNKTNPAQLPMQANILPMKPKALWAQEQY